MKSFLKVKRLYLGLALLSSSVGLIGCSGGSGGPVLPGGEGKIVFTSTRDGNTEIYIMNPDGSDQTRLTRNAAFDTSPTLNSRRDKVAFTSHGDDPNGDIYLLDVNTKSVRRLASGNLNDFDPTFNPKTEEIAFISDRDGELEIYVMGSDGSHVRKLSSSDQIFVRNPSYRDDGQRIVFIGSSGADGGGGNIFTISSQGGAIVQLTTGEWDNSPSYSPDGRQIVFSSLRNGNSDIYLINADGSNLRRLTTTPEADEQPTFSPDGKRIAFISKRSGRYAVHVMNVDGTQVQQHTTEGDDSSPDWR